MRKVVRPTPPEVFPIVTVSPGTSSAQTLSIDSNSELFLEKDGAKYSLDLGESIAWFKRLQAATEFVDSIEQSDKGLFRWLSLIEEAI